MRNEDKTFDLIKKMYVEFSNKFQRMNQEFEKIDQRFQNIDQRFEKIDQRFENIDQRFENIDQRFDNVENEIKEVKDIQIRMENKFTNKIDALFDGHKQTNDKIDRVEATVNNLAQKVDQQEIKLKLVK